MAEKQYRNFCFTLNNWQNKEWAYLETIKCKYIVYGREIGEKEQTPHLQGFITFTSAKTLSAAFKALKHCHVEIAATIHEAIKYCKKGGDFTERGKAPMSQQEKGATEVERYQQAWEAAKAGDIEAIPADIRFKCYNTIRSIAKDYATPPDDLDDVCGVWFYGDPGTGKSYTARNEFGKFYLKETNKWWDSYQGEETVIIDEVELDHGKFIGHYLKKWADRYAFDAEIKGAKLIIRPKRIIVTSNYSIDEIFGSDHMLCEAIKRRFKSRHFSRLGNGEAQRKYQSTPATKEAKGDAACFSNPALPRSFAADDIIKWQATNPFLQREIDYESRSDMGTEDDMEDAENASIRTVQTF